MYTIQLCQTVAELLAFLNTGGAGGTPITRTQIVVVDKDPGNGSWFVILAPA